MSVFYLDWVRHSSSLVAVHSADNVAHMAFLVDFLVVVDILADDLLLAAFHDDTLEAQHLVHNLVVHTVALLADSYLADILDLAVVDHIHNDRVAEVVDSLDKAELVVVPVEEAVAD